jgi:hypothetical protein
MKTNASVPILWLSPWRKKSGDFLLPWITSASKSKVEVFFRPTERPWTLGLGEGEGEFAFVAVAKKTPNSTIKRII